MGNAPSSDAPGHAGPVGDAHCSIRYTEDFLRVHSVQVDPRTLEDDTEDDYLETGSVNFASLAPPEPTPAPKIHLPGSEEAQMQLQKLREVENERSLAAEADKLINEMSAESDGTTTTTTTSTTLSSQDRLIQQELQKQQQKSLPPVIDEANPYTGPIRIEHTPDLAQSAVLKRQAEEYGKEREIEEKIAEERKMKLKLLHGIKRNQEMEFHQKHQNLLQTLGQVQYLRDVKDTPCALEEKAMLHCLRKQRESGDLLRCDQLVSEFSQCAATV